MLPGFRGYGTRKYFMNGGIVDGPPPLGQPPIIPRTTNHIPILIALDLVQYHFDKNGLDWPLKLPRIKTEPTNQMIDVRMFHDSQVKVQHEKLNFEKLLLNHGLYVSSTRLYPMFMAVLEDINADEHRSWWRVLITFHFGALLAEECLHKDHVHMIEFVIDWVASYVEYYFGKWIREQGGWKACTSNTANM